MDDLELTDEERAMLREVALLHPQLGIMKAVKTLQARGDRAEFYLEHREDEDTGCCISCNDRMHKNRNASLDHRHAWKTAQWIEAAQMKLAIEG